MQPSRSLAEAYFFGSPRRIGAKILFIKRADRLAEYARTSPMWSCSVTSGMASPVSCTANRFGDRHRCRAQSDRRCGVRAQTPGATCLYSGTCGGLRDGLTVGDNFVAEQAVCGEGHTLHFGYAPFSLARGDPDALQASERRSPRPARFHAGMTYTKFGGPGN